MPVCRCSGTFGRAPASYSSAGLVARVASLSGVRAVTLVPSVGGTPEARDYLALFDLDVARLAETLRAR